MQLEVASGSSAAQRSAASRIRRLGRSPGLQKKASQDTGTCRIRPRRYKAPQIRKEISCLYPGHGQRARSLPRMRRRAERWTSPLVARTPCLGKISVVSASVSQPAADMLQTPAIALSKGFFNREPLQESGTQPKYIPEASVPPWQHRRGLQPLEV